MRTCIAALYALSWQSSRPAQVGPCSVLAGLPILLRVLLLPRYPVAQPLLVILLPGPAFLRARLLGAARLDNARLRSMGRLTLRIQSRSAEPLDELVSRRHPRRHCRHAYSWALLPRLFKIHLKWGKASPPPIRSLESSLRLCVSQFLFWYGLHLCAPDAVVTAMRQYEAWP